MNAMRADAVLEKNRLKDYLNTQFAHFNNASFVKDDPISIPHRFKLLQDIEISAFFAAILAWGNRTTIINKCTELMQLMDNSPYQFILQHERTDLKKLFHFKHRTFNSTDLLYFIEFFRFHYSTHNSLESAFTRGMKKGDAHMEAGLDGFYHYFFSLPDIPGRTRKHIAAPHKNSGCKRLNMFLRWMVREDEAGVDFGIWQNIQPSQLICPVDVHVSRVARRLGLLTVTGTSWKAAVELTQNLKAFDAKDPVKYDFALFGTGVNELAIKH